MNNYSPLLINEPPLQVLPSLAVAIGLNESIIVQQMHYWLINQNVGVMHENLKWIFNSYPEWQNNFPFWSIPTIQRTFASLEKQGIIIAKQLGKNTMDRTKYYRLDYDKLRMIDHINLIPSTISNCHHVPICTETTIPETTENKEVYKKRETVRKVHVPRVCNSTELFEKDEVPTRAKVADEKIWKAYLRIHEIAGLGVPRTYRNKEEKPTLAKALIDNIDAERLGIALQKALETDEPKFWPINRVISSLHILEAQLKKKPTFDERHLTPQEVEDARGARLQATFDKILGRV